MDNPTQDIVRDETWYVAIMRSGGSMLNVFIGAGGESYRNYSKNTKKYGMGVVAERFEVDNKKINELTGFDETGKLVSEGGPLRKLVDRLNSGDTANPQEELDRLCLDSSV